MPMDAVWNDWSGGALEIDRFGDQRDRLGFSSDESNSPVWRDFHPWFGIQTDLNRPWHDSAPPSAPLRSMALVLMREMT